jgi:hypothetical protein
MKDRLTLLSGTELFIAIAIGVIGVIFLIAVFASWTSKSAYAAPVVLGTFESDEYVYEPTTLFRDENVVLVWVATKSKKFNYSDDPDYAGATGRFAIDCSGHTSVFIEGMTFDKKGKTIQSGKVPENKWVFVPIMEHTPEYALFRMICVAHPII